MGKNSASKSQRGGEADDGGVLTIEGEGSVDATSLSHDEVSSYLDKYLQAMRADGFTPEEAFAEYSTVIRVTPIRARTY